MEITSSTELKSANEPAFGTGTGTNINLSQWIIVVAVLLATCFISNASGSAIPMWEFLSREEKTSHLFNMFAKQAAEHCKSSTMPDCNKVILIYGLSNLAKMDDLSLDQMDPYQRGANDKIWESIMKDSDTITSHSYSQSQSQSQSQPQPQSEISQATAVHDRDYYADALEPAISTDENYLGSASNNVEEIISGDGDRDGYTNANVNAENDSSYMSGSGSGGGGGGGGGGGPMIVRVRTDGSPIPDQKQTYLPKDEDMEEHNAMRSKLVPSISELQEFFSSSTEAVTAAAAADTTTAPSQKEYAAVPRDRL